MVWMLLLRVCASWRSTVVTCYGLLLNVPRGGDSSVSITKCSAVKFVLCRLVFNIAGVWHYFLLLYSFVEVIAVLFNTLLVHKWFHILMVNSSDLKLGILCRKSTSCTILLTFIWMIAMSEQRKLLKSSFDVLRFGELSKQLVAMCTYNFKLVLSHCWVLYSKLEAVSCWRTWLWRYFSFVWK